MQNELIHAAAKLFPTINHWRSFQELAKNMDAIKEEWFVAATDMIREHFKNALSPEWRFTPIDPPTRNTCWFLRDYGPGSLSIRFWACYRFELKADDKKRFDLATIRRLLTEKDYLPISQAFARIDPPNADDSLFMEMPNFKFGKEGDGHYSDLDLAWYAAHETDSFVEQAIAKIEKFTKNPQVTELLQKVNQIAQAEAQAGKK